MVPPADTREATVREFADRFGRRALADAAGLLTEAGRERVVASLPAAFVSGDPGSVEALEAYRWGLKDRYGEFVTVDGVELADGKATVGLEFTEGGAVATVGVDDDGVTDLSFSPGYTTPAYADGAAFEEREVTVDAGDVALGGVLTVPDGGGPFPGIVFVHGHGVHDPDGTAGATKILKDLAWGLAGEGIASLRYEKRLHDHEVPDGEYTLDTVVVDDAVAALDELADADAVNEDDCFVAGHSQGGMCAPWIADRHGTVAGVVNLDGTADPIVDPEDLTPIRYEMDPDGDLDEDEQVELEAKRETFRRIADGEFEDDETLVGYPGAWHRSHLEYDPVGTACDLGVPVFVASTERVDEQRQSDLLKWRREKTAAWETADLPDGSRVESYEAVGHYFQAGPTPSRPIGLYFGGNVERYVVEDVAEWVHEVADG